MNIYVRSLEAIARGTATAVRVLVFGRAQPVQWVDDGLCTCPDCARPPYLVGDDRPAGTPLPDELLAYEREGWPT